MVGMVAHCRAEHLEPPDDVADEVGELVQWLGSPDQGIVLNPAHPRRHGFRFDEKGFGGQGEVPAPGGFQFQDGHAFGGRVERPVSGRDPAHPGVFDPEFLPEQCDFVFSLVQPAGQPGTSERAVGAPAAGVCGRGLGEGCGADHNRPHMFRPSCRQRCPHCRLPSSLASFTQLASVSAMVCRFVNDNGSREKTWCLV